MCAHMCTVFFSSAGVVVMIVFINSFISFRDTVFFQEARGSKNVSAAV